VWKIAGRTESAEHRSSVFHVEGRGILWPRLAVIVDACGADARVAEALLDLRDVGAGVDPRHVDAQRS
jgi:hypothetical protein